MKKVLIITYYWPPSGGAGVQRWVKFAKYLSKIDVDVFVLTVNTKYATYPQIDESLQDDIPENVKVFRTKSFELYSLYKKVSSNKEAPYGGFINTKKLDFKEKVIRFIRGNFFLPDPRRGWNRYAFRKAKELIEINDIDTIITTSPPHSTQLIGLKLKKKLNVKWVVDLRDPWTDIYYYKELYPTKVATAINKSHEKRILKYSDKIITVSNDLQRLFSSKLVGIREKIAVIPNGYDSEEFLSVDKIKQADYFYISYIGTISDDYFIDAFITAIEHLPEEIRNKLRLRFVGKISPKLLKKFTEAELTKQLEVIDYVEHSKAISYMVSSAILLLIIPKIKNNKGILTGKLFEYLASCRPILFIGPTDGDAAKIIDKASAGNCHDFNDSEGIKNTIFEYFKLYQNNNLTIQSSFYEKYSRKNLAKDFIDLISIK
jgi:glycosyltransferase involved in cell wall biosynthesis